MKLQTQSWRLRSANQRDVWWWHFFFLPESRRPFRLHRKIWGDCLQRIGSQQSRRGRAYLVQARIFKVSLGRLGDLQGLAHAVNWMISEVHDALAKPLSSEEPASRSLMKQRRKTPSWKLLRGIHDYLLVLSQFRRLSRDFLIFLTFSLVTLNAIPYILISPHFYAYYLSHGFWSFSNQKIEYTHCSYLS